MKIGSRAIGDDAMPFVVAEIGVNHNGDMDLARRLIDAAAAAGADCVKVQSWTKDSLFAREVYDNDRFLSDGRDDGGAEPLEDLVGRYSLSEDDLRVLAAHSAKRGILFSSSVFSLRELEFLVDVLDTPFVKVASMDVTNLPFLDAIARKGRPVVLSTGLASLSEIAAAVETVMATDNHQLVLLHCVAQYPPANTDLNLRNINMLRDAFRGVPVGYSDHSIGITIPIAAIARGACLIEKHFTLDKEMEGWDHAISAEPAELSAIVAEGRRVAAALGSYGRRVSDEDMEMRRIFRRSIVAARPIKAGAVIVREDLDFKRPGRGLPPHLVNMVIGRTARRDIDADEILGEDAF